LPRISARFIAVGSFSAAVERQDVMDTQDALARLLDANAAVLNLPISEAQRPGVLSYLALAESMHRILLPVQLGPTDESALVFVPQPPGAGHE
jgi:hypothetical protein